MISLLLFTIGVVTWDIRWVIAAYVFEVLGNAIEIYRRRVSRSR